MTEELRRNDRSFKSWYEMKIKENQTKSKG